MSIKSLRLSAAAACALLAAAPAAAGGELVAPAYPSGTRDKPLEVNVVAWSAVAAGAPAAPEILYNDGADEFAAAAVAALAKSSFDEARTEVTAWYKFKLLQDTEVRDVTRGVYPPDEPPALVEHVAPTFPAGAPSIRVEVKLLFLVGEDGATWFVKPEDGVNELYTARALEAGWQFKFEPAVKDGAATVAWLPLVIEFQ
jgi:hypothetical protein